MKQVSKEDAIKYRQSHAQPMPGIETKERSQAKRK
jgi:hypothetical protein